MFAAVKVNETSPVNYQPDEFRKDEIFIIPVVEMGSPDLFFSRPPDSLGD